MNGLVKKVFMLTAGLALTGLVAGCELDRRGDMCYPDDLVEEPEPTKYVTKPPQAYGEVLPYNPVEMIESDERFYEIKNGEEPAMIAFHFEGCHWCPPHMEIFYAIAPDYAGALVLADFDATGNFDLPQRENIYSYPTTACYWNGERHTDCDATGGLIIEDEFREKMECCAALANPPEPVEVFTEDRFFELLYGGENFMINFHTDWCGACPEHLEKLRNAAPSVEGRLVVGEIDITANWERPDDPIMELLGTYGVSGVPNTLCFNGEEHFPEYRLRGVLPDQDEFFEKLEGCASLDE